MEKYDAIMRAINAKLADNELVIGCYREEMPKKDAEIQKLKDHIEMLETKLRELSTNYDNLHESYDKKLDEISELKATNAKLTARVNELEKF